MASVVSVSDEPYSGASCQYVDGAISLLCLRLRCIVQGKGERLRGISEAHASGLS
ncbi:hypothetical protein PCI56_13530 [Plesiomonas shigelloides subsp. oncorhynchi]|nr:hypothetical protein [Plesiomonas shigelloides]